MRLEKYIKAKQNLQCFVQVPRLSFFKPKCLFQFANSVVHQQFVAEEWSGKKKELKLRLELIATQSNETYICKSTHFALQTEQFISSFSIFLSSLKKSLTLNLRHLCSRGSKAPKVGKIKTTEILCVY